jgi:hypothetical protein
MYGYRIQGPRKHLSCQTLENENISVRTTTVGTTEDPEGCETLQDQGPEAPTTRRGREWNPKGQHRTTRDNGGLAPTTQHVVAGNQ